MIPIPVELLEQFERGNVLLFIGERITRDAEGKAIIDRWVDQLAMRCGIANEGDQRFPVVAQAYEDTRGRHALVQFLLDRLEELGDEPQQAHRLIADLTDCKVLVSDCLDRRLERAFEEKGRRFDVIIGDVDVALEDERKTRLYKLRGSMEQVASLVLTEDDYDAFFFNQASIITALQTDMARKTILFLGYDLTDEHFKPLYCKALAHLDKLARPAYAFGETPPPRVCRWCERRGIDIVEADATAFLEALTRQLALLPKGVPPPPSRPEPPLDRPYKFLDYYGARDKAIFFGRQQEKLKLSQIIAAHRLVLLYGPSGVGKTSLLRAGVVPRLRDARPPYETICVRTLEDPALVIRRAVRRRLPEVNLPEDGSLVDFLDAAARALDRTLVIILDQFEEFFIRLEPQRREAFIAELGALYDARDVPVKVVLSLREEWLGSITEIEQRIPEAFRTRMRLKPMNRDQARQAITQPVEKLGVEYEETLVERLLSELLRSDRVMPPRLQIVCSALYDARRDGNIIDSAAYDELGGAETILSEYLKEELRRFEPHQALVYRLLEELVTSKGARLVKGTADMAQALDLAAEELQPLLDRLVTSRLIRRVEREDGQINYELIHEYIAQDVPVSEESRQRKQAEEWLEQGLKDWLDSKGKRRTRRGEEVLIGPQRLKAIATQYELKCLRVKKEDKESGVFELLLLSALQAGQRIDYWANGMASLDADTSHLATRHVADALLDPNRSLSTTRAIQISKEFLDENWQEQLAQELGDRYLAQEAPGRQRLVDPLWALRKHLSRSLRMRVWCSKARQQVALHAREVAVGIAVLIVATLVVGGYSLYLYLQRGTWTEYKFNEIGDVSYIAVTPGNERLLWALVEGGRYGRQLHRSEDGGDHWELVSASTTRESVTDMVAGLGDHGQPLVYMATLGMGVYVFDGETRTIELRNAGLRSYSIKDLVTDPEDHTTIYLGTGDKRGIYVSTNFGGSWQQIGGDALSNESIISIAALSHPLRIYALTRDDRVWFGDGRTPDWKLAVPEGCDPTRPEAIGCDLRFTLYGKGRITSLAADRQNRLLYAATTARLIGVLDDATQRWRVRFIKGSESHESMGHITVTGGDEPLLYVIVWRDGGDSLYRSRDEGQTWDLVAASELSRSGLHRLVADPTSSNRLYVASDLGAARTIDGGEDWSLMALDLAPTPVRGIHVAESASMPLRATLYLSARSAVYRSALDVESTSWARAHGLDAVAVRDLTSDPRDPDVLYAGVFSPRQWSVFVSRDRGQNWELLGLPPEEFRDDDTWSVALAALDGHRAILYAGTNGSGILRAELGSENTDREIEWTQWPGVSNVHKVLVAPWDPQVAYALADGRTLIRTANAGLDWTTIGDIPGTAPVIGLETGTDPGTLYLSMRGGGILRTADRGENWEHADAELPDHSIVSMAVGRGDGDTLYVVTEAGVVYRSKDAGNHWQNIREKLDIMYPRELTVRQYGAPELILASDSGVYGYTRNSFMGFQIP